MQIPLSILNYRRLRRDPDPLFPEVIDARRFEQQLRLLKRWCHVLPLAEALERLAERTLPAGAACITFDAGYAEHAQVALPLLVRFGMPATFFIASGYLDGHCMWPDALAQVVRDAPGERLNLVRSGFGTYQVAQAGQRRAVYDMLASTLNAMPAAERQARIASMARRFAPTMLSAEQLLALHRAGMEIGSQTVSYPALATISNTEARSEIANGRATLQQLIQAPVRYFAYPQGRPGEDFERRHVNMLRTQGFEAAVTTAAGAARSHTDPFLLPRFTPQDRTGRALLLGLVRNLFATAA